MKKLILFLAIIIIVTSCQKSETVTPHYSQEQLEVLHILCDNMWRCDNHGYKFACLNYQPFDVSSPDGGTYRVDGVFRFYVVDWGVSNNYYYFQLLSDSSMRCFAIFEYDDNSNRMEEILQTRPPFTRHSATPKEFEISSYNWGGYNLKFGDFTYTNY